MKELYIDAICGAGFPSYGFADEAVKAGEARFTGNQYNDRWEGTVRRWTKAPRANCTCCMKKSRSSNAGK